MKKIGTKDREVVPQTPSSPTKTLIAIAQQRGAMLERRYNDAVGIEQDLAEWKQNHTGGVSAGLK